MADLYQPRRGISPNGTAGTHQPGCTGTGRYQAGGHWPWHRPELRKHGLRADLIPEVYDGTHLGQALCEAKPVGKVLILRAQWGTKTLTDALDRGTISYDDIRCYETQYTAPNTEEVRKLLVPGTIVTFTSASTVTGFVSALGENTDFSAITAACIGQQTEAAAHQLQFAYHHCRKSHHGCTDSENRRKRIIMELIQRPRRLRCLSVSRSASSHVPLMSTQILILKYHRCCKIGIGHSINTNLLTD